jgi:hypothetical protein
MRKNMYNTVALMEKKCGKKAGVDVTNRIVNSIVRLGIDQCVCTYIYI